MCICREWLQKNKHFVWCTQIVNRGANRQVRANATDVNWIWRKFKKKNAHQPAYPWFKLIYFHLSVKYCEHSVGYWGRIGCRTRFHFSIHLISLWLASLRVWPCIWQRNGMYMDCRMLPHRCHKLACSFWDKGTVDFRRIHRSQRPCSEWIWPLCAAPEMQQSTRKVVQRWSFSSSIQNVRWIRIFIPNGNVAVAVSAVDSILNIEYFRFVMASKIQFNVRRSIPILIINSLLIAQRTQTLVTKNTI